MRQSASGERSFSDLTDLALGGDEAAWRELCGRLKNVAWKTINSFRLAQDDAEDAFAATFFRLAENLGKIRDPGFLPGWTATTARNEVLSLLRARSRLLPVGGELEDVAEVSDHAERLLDDELRIAVLKAFHQLSERCKQLLRMLTIDPPLSYQEIAVALGTAHGTLGPTRGRCLDQLRARPELDPFLGREQ